MQLVEVEVFVPLLVLCFMFMMSGNYLEQFVDTNNCISS